jgi:integrase
VASLVKRDTTAGPRYDVRYRDPKGAQRKRTFKRAADARTFTNTVEADIIRDEWTDPLHGKVTFADWWERWWTTTVNLRPSTRARDESYARNHLLPEFGTLGLSDIDHTAVTAWVAKLSASGLAPATVVKAAQILGKTLNGAVDAGMIRTSPAARVKLPRIERHEMRFLTADEIDTLADVIDERYRAFVLTGAWCGLRLGELSGLRRNRVDLLRRRVEVAEIVVEVRGKHLTGPPKTRAGHRSVPVPRHVAEALQAHMNGVSGETVFAAPDGGLLRASLFRRRVWEPACVNAGLGRWWHADPAKMRRLAGTGRERTRLALRRTTHPRLATHRRRALDRGRCQSERDRTARRTLVRRDRARPLRTPAPRPRGERYRRPRRDGCPVARSQRSYRKMTAQSSATTARKATATT